LPTNSTLFGGFGSTECPKRATAEPENDRESPDVPEALGNDDDAADEPTAVARRDRRRVKVREEDETVVCARLSLSESKPKLDCERIAENMLTG
jgi:hypothetical protein